MTATVFECAGRSLARGSTEHLTPAWLLTVAKRRLIDHWRFDARSSSHAEIDVPAAERNNVPESVDVERLLASLPDRHQRCLEARYLRDEPVSVVAALLSTTYTAAEAALHRARRAARARMEPGYLLV